MLNSDQLPDGEEQSMDAETDLAVSDTGIEDALRAMNYSATYVEETRKTIIEVQEKVNEMSTECQQVKEKLFEKLQQITKGQSELVTKECDLNYVKIKVKVLEDCCNQLEQDYMIQIENMMKSKKHLHERSMATLNSCSEFSLNWNCIESCGGELRKQVRKKRLDGIKNLKHQLEQEVEKYLEQNREYENALTEKMKLESEAELRMKDLSRKESHLHEKLEGVEKKMCEFEKLQENSRAEHSSENMRLQAEIKRIELSILDKKSKPTKPNIYNTNTTLTSKPGVQYPQVNIQPRPSNPNVNSANTQYQFVKYTKREYCLSPLKFRAVESRVTASDRNQCSQLEQPCLAKVFPKPVYCKNGVNAHGTTSVANSACSSFSQKFQFKKKTTSAATAKFGDSLKEQKPVGSYLNQQALHISATNKGFTSAKKVYLSNNPTI